jgi:hypothetical protein
MANAAPATVTVTSTTGPGQSVTALKATDVSKFEVDFGANVIKVTRQGSGSTQIYDYSAMATLTWTISGGVTTIVVSS